MSPHTQGHCTRHITHCIGRGFSEASLIQFLLTIMLSMSPHRLKLIFILLIFTLICFVHQIKWIGELPCLVYLWHWELDDVLISVTWSDSHSFCPSSCKTSNGDNNNYQSDKKVVKHFSLMFVTRF